MHRSIPGRVLLVATCWLAGTSAWAQRNANKFSSTSANIGVTFAVERAYIAPGSCECFWFRGGGTDVGFNLWKGLGVAAAFTGDHASNVRPGVDISKLAYMFGPRYTYTPASLNAHISPRFHGQLFGEGLFGAAHAFNSAFPSTAGLKTSADSFAMQIGGGVNVLVSDRFAVRALEASFVRTSLPNNASDVQNDLRLGFGVTYHVGKLAHSR